MVMLRKDDGVSIWKIPHLNNRFAGTGDVSQWKRIVDLKVKGLSATTLSNISPDGQWVLIGDLWQVKLFQVQHVTYFCLLLVKTIDLLRPIFRKRTL